MPSSPAQAGSPSSLDPRPATSTWSSPCLCPLDLHWVVSASAYHNYSCHLFIPASWWQSPAETKRTGFRLTLPNLSSLLSSVCSLNPGNTEYLKALFYSSGNSIGSGMAPGTKSQWVHLGMLFTIQRHSAEWPAVVGTPSPPEVLSVYSACSPEAMSAWERGDVFLYLA